MFFFCIQKDGHLGDKSEWALGEIKGITKESAGKGEQWIAVFDEAPLGKGACHSRQWHFLAERRLLRSTPGQHSPSTLTVPAIFGIRIVCIIHQRLKLTSSPNSVEFGVSGKPLKTGKFGFGAVYDGEMFALNSSIILYFHMVSNWALSLFSFTLYIFFRSSCFLLY